jgi:hypothetical protein
MEHKKGWVTEGSFSMPSMPVVLLGCVCTAFRCLHVPALRKIFRARLGEELADDRSLRGSELVDDLRVL